METTKDSPAIALPESVLQTLKGIADAVPDAVAVQFGRQFPELATGGFQIHEKNAGHFRHCMKRAIRSPFAPSEWLRTSLADAGLNRRMFAVFSEEALELALDALISIYGAPTVIAGLLLDGRPSVRTMAREAIDRLPAELVANDPQAGRTDFLNLFSPFLTELSTFTAPDLQSILPPATPLVAVREGPGWEQRFNAEKQAHERDLEQQRRTRERLEERIAKLEASLQESERESSKWQQKHTESSKALIAQTESLAKERTTRSNDVRHSVHEQLRDLALRWLNRYEQTESFTEQAVVGGAKLEARAVAALVKQAEADRHFGNIHQLHHELNRLCELRAQLREAHASAIHPLTELVAVEQDVDRDITRLRGVLGEDAGEEPVIARLLARMNAADTLETLEPIRPIIQMFDTACILPQRQLKTLYRAYQDRIGRFVAEQSLGNVKIIAGPDPTFRTMRGSQHGEPFTWSIDGHNVLFTLPDIFGPLNDPASIRTARERLIEAVTHLFRSYPEGDACLYFDGPQHQTSSSARNVRVIYSGGTGEHRADNAMLNDLDFVRRDNPKRSCWIVTGDTDLYRQASRIGVECLSVAEFAALCL